MTLVCENDFWKKRKQSSMICLLSQVFKEEKLEWFKLIFDWGQDQTERWSDNHIYWNIEVAKLNIIFLFTIFSKCLC